MCIRNRPDYGTAYITTQNQGDNTDPSWHVARLPWKRLGNNAALELSKQFAVWRLLGRFAIDTRLAITTTSLANMIVYFVGVKTCRKPTQSIKWSRGPDSLLASYSLAYQLAQNPEQYKESLPFNYLYNHHASKPLREGRNVTQHSSHMAWGWCCISLSDAKSCYRLPQARFVGVNYVVSGWWYSA